jgi:hypothetical protein
MPYVKPVPQQKIGRETFGLIVAVWSTVAAVLVVLTFYFFVEDAGLLMFVPLIPITPSIIFGILIMKGLIYKQMKSNAEIAAERRDRR